MKSRFTLNLGSILGLIMMSYLTYYLLVKDNALHLSISSILTWERFLTHKYGHVFISGLLPIYIALMIFGTSIIAMHLGSKLQQHVLQFLEKSNVNPD